MNVKQLIIKEIRHRLFSFCCGALIVCLSIGCLLVSIGLLRDFDSGTAAMLSKHEKETAATMKKLEDQIRKEMKGLGFNIYIFPEGQDMQEVYSKGYASKTMPEDYVHKLAETPTLSKINHLLPSLTQKLVWPEQKRTIVLIGIKGQVPIAHRVASDAKKNKKQKPLVNPVGKGKAVVGYELQQSLGLKPGEKITIMGREFIIEKLNDARGNADDISIWINLDECQAMLNKEKQINAILALECNCASLDRLGEIRKEVQAILPGTEIIEVKSKALARAEARITAKKTAESQIEIIKTQRAELKAGMNRNSALITVIFGVLAIMTVWILSMNNVNQRRSEIGIYRSFGCKNSVIMKLILGRSFLLGCAGTFMAVILAPLAFKAFSQGAGFMQSFKPEELVMIVLSGPLLAVAAALYPCRKASAQDPVSALRNES